MKARITAYIPSRTECCFKNTVERQISTMSTNEPAFSIFLPLKNLLFDIAIWAASELSTWILGHIFEEESALYIKPMTPVNISESVSAGLSV